MKHAVRLLPALLLLCSLQASAVEKVIYGLNEYVLIDDFGLQIPAKLDTGARTASLSAHDIERFTRDGQSWVRFTPDLRGFGERRVEKPLARVSRIKRRHGDYDPEEEKRYTSRPVIEIEICIGSMRRNIEVNLTDRSAFNYPLLIGSKALRHLSAIVDPSLKYAAGRPDCPPAAQPGEKS